MAERERIGRVYRFFSGLFRLLFRLFLRLKTRGMEHVPRTGGCILVANHVSFLDPPVLGCMVRFRQVHFMARDSLFHCPLFGAVLRRLAVIPLQREGGDVGALRAGVRVLRKGRVLGLFPEGTRSPDGKVYPAKGGLGFLAVHGRAPVVPAFIEGAYRAWPRSRRLPRPARVTVTYGEPIPFETIRSWQTGDDPYQAVADRLMSAVAELGGGEVHHGPGRGA